MLDRAFGVRCPSIGPGNDAPPGGFQYTARWSYVHFPFEIGQAPAKNALPFGADIWTQPTQAPRVSATPGNFLYLQARTDRSFLLTNEIANRYK